MLRRLLVLSLALGLLAVPALAADPATPEPTTPAAKAEALFKAGKIAEARDAYAAAAKADPEDAEAARQAELLSRVLEMEAAIKAEEPSPRWERMVCTLHAFYLRSDLPEKALALDEAAHGRIDSATTAGLKLETLLDMGANDKALAFAEGLREGQMTDGNRIYKGIAAARLGKTDLVREDLELYGAPEATDAGLHFDLARLQALLGEKDAALTSLVSAFETCPPRAIPTLKSLATASPDFAKIRGEAFDKALATPSKVSECGGCGGCGGCAEKSEGCGGCSEKKDGECGSCPAGEKAGSGGCKGGCPAAGG